MQERHLNRKKYFFEQGITTRKYVIPYIQDIQPIKKNTRVLEIGCGEGGNILPFLEIGCDVVGIDINKGQIANAREFIADVLPSASISLINKNIYEIEANDIGVFDVIMLRDVIEHIPNQDRFLKHLKSFLNVNGKVFFGFPPWCMPFGGHQQVCKSSFLSKMPYYHLLPEKIYAWVLNLFGERDGTIKSLLEIKETGISINRFQKIVSNNDYQIDKRTLFMINPNYEVKFGLKPRNQFKIIQSIPFFRDFLTTCYYGVISLNVSSFNQENENSTN